MVDLVISDFDEDILKKLEEQARTLGCSLDDVVRAAILDSLASSLSDEEISAGKLRTFANGLARVAVEVS